MSKSNSNFIDNLDTLEPSTNTFREETNTDESLRTVNVQFRVTPALAEIIDKAVDLDGCGSRSHLCRSALNDKLASLGMF